MLAKNGCGVYADVTNHRLTPHQAHHDCFSTSTRISRLPFWVNLQWSDFNSPSCVAMWTIICFERKPYVYIQRCRLLPTAQQIVSSEHGHESTKTCSIRPLTDRYFWTTKSLFTGILCACFSLLTT